MELILKDSEYSYVASTKVITLASPYTALSLGQIKKITDITTGSVFYDVETQRYPISISGADITHAYNDDVDADTDKLMIIIDIGGSSSTPIKVSTADLLKETLLDGVTTTGASADQLVQNNKELTIEIVAENVTLGCTAKMQATSDNINYGDLAVIDKFGNILQTITIAASGTYYYEIVNASSLKYVRSNIITRSDGTYTVKILGGA